MDKTAYCSFKRCDMYYPISIINIRIWQISFESRLFRQHEETKVHKLQERFQPPLDQGQTTLQLTSTCDSYPDDAIWIRFQAAWWLANQDISITKFAHHLEHILSTHGYTATAYCDDKSAWEFIVILAKWFRTQLQNRLRGSPYYGIMVDETTDKSTTSQLIIYVKYLRCNSEGDLMVTSEYLDLISLNGSTASDITIIFYY
jgi:hypothetical protein